MTEKVKAFNQMLKKEQDCFILTPIYRETGKVIVQLDAKCSSPIYAELDFDEMKIVRVWSLW